jgi:prevent-host-death family protein
MGTLGAYAKEVDVESINIRQAREKLSELVDSAEQGESIAITRHGKKVAVLGPVRQEGFHLPDLTEFRASMVGQHHGQALSNTIIELRENERY